MVWFRAQSFWTQWAPPNQAQSNNEKYIYSLSFSHVVYPNPNITLTLTPQLSDSDQHATTFTFTFTLTFFSNFLLFLLLRHLHLFFHLPLPQLPPSPPSLFAAAPFSATFATFSIHYRDDKLESSPSPISLFVLNFYLGLWFIVRFDFLFEFFFWVRFPIWVS